MASTDKLDKLRKLSLEARNQSYSPYSKFRVGCVILTEDGEYIQGANVENVSYGAAICAERTAVVKAVTAGKSRWKAIAIASDLEGPCSPCGICRQVEFADLDLPVYMFDKNGEYVHKTLGELLPMSFGPGTI